MQALLDHKITLGIILQKMPSKSSNVELGVVLNYQAGTEIIGDSGSCDDILTVNAEIRGLPFLRDNENTHDVKLGELKFYVIRIGNVINNNENLFSVLDRHQEILDVGTEIFDNTTREFKPIVQRMFEDAFSFEDILLLHLLKIYPVVRGQCLGLVVLHQAMKDWSNGCSLVAMKPFPLQFQAEMKKRKDWNQFELGRFPRSQKIASDQLRNYYERLGFQRIGRSLVYARCAKTQLPSIQDLGYSGSISISVDDFHSLPPLPPVVESVD